MYFKHLYFFSAVNMCSMLANVFKAGYVRRMVMTTMLQGKVNHCNLYSDIPYPIIQGNIMADVWAEYVGLVLTGTKGFDENIELRERFFVELVFSPDADGSPIDWYTDHPEMDVSQQPLYLDKMFNINPNNKFGGSYGYRIRKSYGVDQMALAADRIISKPESKAIIVNLLHPLSSEMERKVNMTRCACMSNMQAIVRDNKIHLGVQFRSQNVWNSHANFKSIHEWHKELLKMVHERGGNHLELGNVVIFINAAHIYFFNFEQAGRVAGIEAPVADNPNIEDISATACTLPKKNAS